jgi:hypothetical protein
MRSDAEVAPCESPPGSQKWTRALQDQSILRPLAMQAALFVPCRHPILRAPGSRIAYVVYRFGASLQEVFADEARSSGEAEPPAQRNGIKE